jgi:sugar lactone lactonase YvrE
MNQYRKVSTASQNLPECVRFSPDYRSLSWVDIERGTLSRLNIDSQELVETGVAPLVSFAEPLENSSFLIAAGGRIGVFDGSGLVSCSQPLLPKGKRFNDGCVDGLGRLIIGSMNQSGASRDNALLIIEPGARLTVLDNDLALSNGVAFDTETCQLFSVDSGSGEVFVRELHEASGEYRGRRVFFSFEEGIVPDGICLDSNGHLVIALWGSSLISIIDRTGAEVHRMATPNIFNTSVALSSDSKTLFLAAATSDRESNKGNQSQLGAVWETSVDLLGGSRPKWNPIKLEELRK